MVWKFCESENLMGISFQKGQILWDFISQCEVKTYIAQIVYPLYVTS